MYLHCMKISNQKLLPPVAILKPQNHQNAFAAGALPQTPLSELTALPRPRGWIKGGEVIKGGGREGNEMDVAGREKRGGIRNVE